MNLFATGLDTETQLLVAIGSSVAAGCIPCLETIVSLAKNENIDPKKLKAAAIIGQFVKDQPAQQIKEVADRMIGTHFLSKPSAPSCPLAPSATTNQSKPTCDCG